MPLLQNRAWPFSSSAHLHNIWRRLWNDAEPSRSILFVRELAVIPKKHLRGVTHFERHTRSVMALGESISRVAMTERVCRLMADDIFCLRNCAIIRTFACKNQSDARALWRMPRHEILLNWNQSPRGRFRL